MIKNIFVALNGFDNANHAFTYSLNIAEKYRAKIILINVIHHVFVNFRIGLGVSSLELSEVYGCLERPEEEIIS